MKADTNPPRGKWDAPIFVLGLLVLLSLLVSTAQRRGSPGDGSGHPAESAAASVVPAMHAPDGGAFRVPVPGDPEYADYREMLASPRFRSSVENSPGYALPYDPEWRSVVEGRRRVAPTNLEFTEGESSMKRLGDGLLQGIREHDLNLLNSLRVAKDEYELILWPEFPQSRPFLKIPVDEAWMFQNSRQRKGLQEILAKYGDRELWPEGLSYESREDYTNFTLYRGVRLRATDVRNGKTADILKEATVAERNGRFKLLSLRS